MATIAEKYNFVFHELTDKRVEQWPFMDSPVPLVITIIGYLYVIYKLGPQYMESRKPYNLKKIIAFYNLFQVFANAIICYSILISGWLTTYSWGCQPVLYTTDPDQMRMAKTVWWLFMLKMVDLIETVFFVLRKKKKQISFLHVYHHVSTLSLVWIGAKYFAGGMATFPMLINCFVHVLMYTYYFLALFGKKMQQRLIKWKQSLTIIQMVQFTIMILHYLTSLTPSCQAPKLAGALMGLPNVLFIYYMFYDFYKNTYMKKTETKKSL
ncbi:elongation of very long chain fatty acids protein AAEL008004-like isoform X2 [Chrysoperla carnea]|uniref:elongation of very long chain fatty acids protein AAEL008004-like isoform X2 n=1 Tax=Chrysoperla carnea TaxID=189513 RepID=UPI001D07873D|nr:elongation of very long chain fatty acids protein AAEL008004-like isoform X2 [Chrysoperla carnea]